MKHKSETWPPPPARPEPDAETDADSDDWLSANDFIGEVTQRDYAVVIFAVCWLLLACFAVVSHYRLLTGIIKHVYHIIRAILP